MPARSNLFQDVVGIIERHKTPDANVTESAMLIDCHTGQEREVDVTVTTEVDGAEIVLSIEAADRGRRATVPWVEQTWAKHCALSTTQLVLVAAAGFYGTALRKAAALGVATVTPEDLPDDDHEFAVIARLTQPPVTLEPALAGLTLEVRPPAETKMDEEDGVPCVYRSDGTRVGVGEIGEPLLDRHLSQVLSAACQDLSRSGRRTSTIRDRPLEPLFGHASGPDGAVIQVAVEAVEVDVSVEVTLHPEATMIARMFETTPALYSEMNVGDAQAVFVTTDHQGITRATLRTREPGQSTPEDWDYDGAIEVSLPPVDGAAG